MERHSPKGDERNPFLKSGKRSTLLKIATRYWRDKLESCKGQKLIYKLAHSMDTAAQDITKCRCDRDPGGNLLCEDLAVKERWIPYFHDLLTWQHK